MAQRGVHRGKCRGQPFFAKPTGYANNAAHRSFLSEEMNVSRAHKYCMLYADSRESKCTTHCRHAPHSASVAERVHLAVSSTTRSHDCKRGASQLPERSLEISSTSTCGTLEGVIYPKSPCRATDMGNGFMSRPN